MSSGSILALAAFSADSAAVRSMWKPSLMSPFCAVVSAISPSSLSVMALGWKAFCARSFSILRLLRLCMVRDG